MSCDFAGCLRLTVSRRRTRFYEVRLRLTVKRIDPQVGTRGDGYVQAYFRTLRLRQNVHCDFHCRTEVFSA